MLKRSISSVKRQFGVAALLVTVLLALVAGVATLYVNRGGLILQKTVANNAQNVMAMQAAEKGVNDFLKQLQSDIDAGGTGVIIKASTGGGAPGCAPGAGSFPYEFTDTYADDDDPTRFAADKFYTQNIAAITNVSNVDPALSSKVQAAIVGDTMHISSTGFALGSSASATVRKNIKISGGFDLGGAGILVGGYADANGSIAVNNFTNKPTCAVAYGDSYSLDSAGVAPIYNCETGTCPPQKVGIVPNNLFQTMFKMSKSEMEAHATKVVTAPIADCSTTFPTANNQIIIINGNQNGNCTIGGSNNLIIVNGDITAGTLVANGLVYTNNLYNNGSIMINGSVVVENVWDVGPLGNVYKNSAYVDRNNQKTDALTKPSPPLTPTECWKDPNCTYETHVGLGSISVNYVKFTPPGGLTNKKITIDSGSWIDF